MNLKLVNITDVDPLFFTRKKQLTLWVFEAWIARILTFAGIPSTNAVVMSETRQAATGICSGNPGSQKLTKNHVHTGDCWANFSSLTGNGQHGHVTYPLIDGFPVRPELPK